MAFIEQFLAIVRNTFFESIRQPIMLVLLIIATVALILCNPLSTFTMADDQRMLIDLGLATVFTCGALLASLVATSVLTREIENKTALTVVSKPVGRPLFVFGKFFGVAAAITVGIIYMSFVYMLVEMHTVLQTARETVHEPVIVFGLGALVVGVLVGVWCNYFYGKVFSSTVILTLTPLAGIAYLLAMMFTKDFTPQSITVAFKGQQWLGILGVYAAVMILTSIAIAASTRLGQVMTLAVTISVFVLGLMSNWMFGRRLAGIRAAWTERARDEGLTTTIEVPRSIELVSGEVVNDTLTREVLAEGGNVDSLWAFSQGLESVDYMFSSVCYTILPNFDTLLLTDALTQFHVVPVSYVVNTSIYALLYVIVALSLAVALFQRREVG